MSTLCALKNLLRRLVKLQKSELSFLVTGNDYRQAALLNDCDRDHSGRRLVGFDLALENGLKRTHVPNHDAAVDIATAQNLLLPKVHARNRSRMSSQLIEGVGLQVPTHERPVLQPTNQKRCVYELQTIYRLATVLRLKAGQLVVF